MPEEHLPREIKMKVFEVTSALYRVTDLFSPQEVLGADLRREGAHILKKCSQFSVLPAESSFEDTMSLLADIRGIRSLLWLAYANGLMRRVNFEVLEREYRALEHFFIQTEQGTRQPTSTPKEEPVAKKETAARVRPENKPVKEKVSKADLEDRKKNILDILNQKDNQSIKDIYMSFKNVSTKTIQRDLQDLIERQLIQRKGDRRWALYSLRREGAVSEVSQSAG